MLQAVDINKRFFRGKGEANYFYAVEKTTLALAPRTLTEITGRSGSGKSTLLNLMAGLLAPSEGQVLFQDTDLYTLNDEARSALRGEHFGIIPQSLAVLQALNVRDNVTLPCRMAGVDVPAEEVTALLQKVGIEALQDAYPNELSGGELRRLSIARALIRKPEVLFADEPTGDLDDENTTAVLDLLRAAADEGAAVLLVTHEEKAHAYADVRFRMDGGVLQSATVS